jgi:hypothetical protein
MGRLRKANERSRRRRLIENNGISHCSYDDLTVVELARRFLTAPERAPSSSCSPTGSYVANHGRLTSVPCPQAGGRGQPGRARCADHGPDWGTRKSTSTEPSVSATAWNTPGGIGWLSPLRRSSEIGATVCIVKWARPDSTRNMPHTPSATRWLRRSPEGKVDSSNGPAVRATTSPAGSSARSQSGQARVVPTCSLRPRAASTQARSRKGGRCRTCCR